MKISITNNPQEKKSDFASAIARKTALVYDFRVVLDDENRFFIIKVPPAKRKAFLQAVEKDAGFVLENFGEILYRGWGEPSDELKQLLQEQYGMYEGEVFDYNW